MPYCPDMDCRDSILLGRAYRIPESSSPSTLAGDWLGIGATHRRYVVQAVRSCGRHGPDLDLLTTTTGGAGQTSW
jgi:hypothetical protein